MTGIPSRLFTPAIASPLAASLELESLEQAVSASADAAITIAIFLWISFTLNTPIFADLRNYNGRFVSHVKAYVDS